VIKVGPISSFVPSNKDKNVAKKKKKGYADSKTHLNRSIDINKYTNRIGVAVLPFFFFSLLVHISF
jgi:hypothetical protein